MTSLVYREIDGKVGREGGRREHEGGIGRERGEGKKETSSLKGHGLSAAPLSLPVRLFPSRLVKKSSLIWVELFHVERRQRPGSVGLVSRNSPNTFTTSLVVQSGSEMLGERTGADGKGGEGGGEME